MPPTALAMPMPMKPIMAPFSFAAAVRIASACEAARLAAAMFGSRMTAAFCRSLIICSSSSDAAMAFTPKLATLRPRSSPHFSDSTSFRASASSVVCAGTAE